MTIRLLAIDIDGTLLDSHGRLPDGNRNAIARAIEAGVEVALATGRRFDYARAVFEQLPRPLTLIASNGAIVRTDQGITESRHLLPRDVARDVLSRTPQHRGGAAVLFDRPRARQVVYETIDWAHPLHHRFFDANRPYLCEVAPLEECLTEDPIQVMFTGTCTEMRALLGELRIAGASLPARNRSNGSAAPDGTPYAVSLTEYVHRDFSLVDVIRAGCSKGAALRECAARRGLAPADVMAIGDNLNDLDMLEFAGTPVVMGNALPELQSRGWAVTATNDEGGVARAIGTYVLSRAS